MAGFEIGCWGHRRNNEGQGKKTPFKHIIIYSLMGDTTEVLSHDPRTACSHVSHYSVEVVIQN